MLESVTNSSLSDRIADVMVDHAKDIATDVVVPTAKYAAIGLFGRHRRTLTIGVVLAAALIGAVKYMRRGDNDTNSSTAPAADVVDNIPTIEDRTPASA